MMERKDGRGHDQMRAIAIEQGLLQQADGSSRVVVGGTRVMAAVYGPAEALQKDELIDKAAIEVLFKSHDGKQDDRYKEYEETVRNCVDAVALSSLHPRTAIRIVVQSITDDGSFFSGMVSSASACACARARARACVCVRVTRVSLTVSYSG